MPVGEYSLYVCIAIPSPAGLYGLVTIVFSELYFVIGASFVDLCFVRLIIESIFKCTDWL